MMANSELENSRIVLTATVTELVQRLEEVVIERETTAEQKRAAESKAKTLERYARQQLALAQASGPKPGVSLPKGKQLRASMASRYY
jgi:hypothetical protein